MAYNLHPVDREQMYLMPSCLRDWLPHDDLVWFISDAVRQMDLSKFYGKYRQDGWGRPAYAPSMLVALLLYACRIGDGSSRVGWWCNGMLQVSYAENRCAIRLRGTCNHVTEFRAVICLRG